MYNKLCFLIFFMYIAYTVANTNDGAVQDLQNTLFEKAGINGTGLPNLDDAQRVFKQKCLKEADEAAYEKANQAKDDLQNCIMGLVDFETLKNEIDVAKPTGDMDEVFKKYCRKSPELKKCISNFRDAVQPCLSKKERDNTKIILNITESLTNFICYKEGDRIALFIAEGGPECLTEKQDGIQNCVNSTMSKYIPEETLSLDNIPELLFQTEQCDDLIKLQNCIVEELSHCAEPTPSNIAESLFKFIRQVTPCSNETAKPAPRKAPISSSGVTTMANSFILFFTVLFSLN